MGGLSFAVNYLYLLVVAYAMRDKWRWLRQQGDDACISSLASFGVVVIIFGLTRPGPPARGMVEAMGFSRMTASWPFNLLLLYFMTTLGVRVVAEITPSAALPCRGRRHDAPRCIRAARSRHLRQRRHGALMVTTHVGRASERGPRRCEATR